MDMKLIQLVYAFYFGTLLINVAVSIVQLMQASDRSRVLVLQFWLAGALTVGANAAFIDRFEMGLMISATGTFISQSLLGSVLASVLKVRVSMRAPSYFFATCGVMALTFYLTTRSGFYFEFFGTIGASMPFFYFAYHAIRGKRHPLTLTQRMFVFTAFALSVHYLDYAFFKLDPAWFLAGSILAFALIHILSILIPMMVVEHGLSERNSLLESEVRNRVEELSRAKEKLWQANQLATLGRMAGGVAHELNSPLSVIALHADRIRYDADRGRLTPELALTQVTGIRRMIDRISNTTGALRKLAKDRLGSQWAPTDVAELLRQAVNARIAQAQASGIRLDLEIQGPRWSLNCDPTELSQAIDSLLENSIDATVPLDEKWICVKGVARDQDLEISVNDSGHIPEDVAARVMDPFFTTKELGKGTGLGLSVTRAIAEAYGGSLYLDASSPNTRFVLVLSHRKEP